MVYEFWVPAVFITMAGVALLVDFDLDDPLEPVAPEADHDDLSLMEPFPDEIEDIGPVGAEPMPGYPLVAANDPTPPDGKLG